MKYVLPNKKYLRNCYKKPGKLIWEPAILLNFTSDKERSILFDAIIPDIQSDQEAVPFLRLLFARDAKSFKFSLKEEIPGYKLPHKATESVIISDIVNAKKRLEKMFATEKEKFNEKFREEFTFVLEWEKFRWLLIPPENFSFSRVFSAGKKIGNITPMIIKDILEIGLGLYPKSEIKYISSKKIYYPLYITDNLIVYEPALKKDPTLSYTSILKTNENLRNLFLKILK